MMKMAPMLAVTATLWMLAALASPAPAAEIALYGELDPAPLEALGHHVTVITLADIESGALSGFDILVAGHLLDDPAWSAAGCTALETFLDAGGGVVVEWNATGLAVTSQGTDPWMPVPVQCGLFAGESWDGDVVGFGTPIAVEDPLSPLVEGLSDGFDMGDGSESFVSLKNLDKNEWVVAATFQGPSGTAPALAAARYRRHGWLVALPMDLFDAFGWGGARETAAETVLADALNVARWPACNPDGSLPVDAADLAEEVRALTDPAYAPPGPADCLPAGGLAASDLLDLVEGIFTSS